MDQQKRIGRILRWHKRHPSDRLRDEVIKHYMYLVAREAEHLHRRLPSAVDVEDLVQDGCFGLLEALDRFDPDKKIQFQTFSPQRIRGAMIDGLRSRDQVSRATRGALRKAEAANEQIRIRTGANPTPQEVAREMGISERSYGKIALSSREIVARSISGERRGDGDGSDQSGQICADSLADPRGPDESVRALMHQQLRDEITTGFSRAERLIVILYYFEEMTMKEIGKTLDLSESRISQMHSSILARLKAKLSEGQLVGSRR